MAEAIKLGIVGYGRIVELVHLPLIRGNPEFSISGVCDITPQRLESASRRGFTVYAQLEDLLDSPVDAVLIATPPDTHYEIAVKALKAGKHVMLEKPVCIDAQEVTMLQALAYQYDKVVSVYQNRRFDNDFLLVRQVLAEGSLGSILFVERRHSSFGSGSSFGVKSFYPNWRNEARFGGGALLDWGVHLVDQLLQLQLGRVDAISACMKELRWQQGDVEDYVRSTLMLDNGILLSLDINFGSNAAFPLWVVGGDKATLQIQANQEAFLYEKGGAATPVALPLVSKDAPGQIYSSFAGRILRKEELTVSLEEAVETMRVMDAMRESSQLKKEITYGSFVR